MHGSWITSQCVVSVPVTKDSWDRRGNRLCLFKWCFPFLSVHTARTQSAASSAQYQVFLSFQLPPPSPPGVLWTKMPARNQGAQRPWCQFLWSFPAPSLHSGSGVVNSGKVWYQSCGSFLPWKPELSIHRVPQAFCKFFSWILPTTPWDKSVIPILQKKTGKARYSCN